MHRNCGMQLIIHVLDTIANFVIIYEGNELTPFRRKKCRDEQNSEFLL